MTNPFAKGTPSLFIVGSPFQALCAIEAIDYFGIKEYKFLLCLLDTPRNNQLFLLLNDRGIKYEIASFNKEYNLNKRIKLSLLCPRWNKYKRAFIGDYRSKGLYCVAFERLSNNSSIIFLDDGNCNIPLLKGLTHPPFVDNGNKFMRMINIVRNITCGKYIFTHYADIKNDGLHIVPNDFESLSKNICDKKKEGICIIGTNPERFAWGYGMTIEEFWLEMEKVLCQIKKENPNKDIYYVPHGRDASSNTYDLCNKHGIRFVRADISVELLLIKMDVIPEIIYGMNSSALYSIRKMMPNIQIKNILFTWPCKYLNNHLAIAEYYKAHGIELIEIKNSYGGNKSGYISFDLPK